MDKLESINNMLGHFLFSFLLPLVVGLFLGFGITLKNPRKKILMKQLHRKPIFLEEFLRKKFRK